MNNYLIPKYKAGDSATYTNKGSSGYTGNDGKEVVIISIKDTKIWATNEPEYIIEFVRENHGFGVRECELNPI